MNMLSGSVDTIGVCSGGPIKSTRGASYAYGQFMIYDGFVDERPWRIERRSGAGHPLFPDASKTHVLYINISRRSGFAGETR
jgi:hypothetical protein